MNRDILIGGAWPYANNSLHLGHISGILSGDILARYHRMKGDNVAFVSMPSFRTKERTEHNEAVYKDRLQRNCLRRVSSPEQRADYTSRA